MYPRFEKTGAGLANRRTNHRNAYVWAPLLWGLSLPTFSAEVFERS